MNFEHSTLTTMPTEWARVDAALDELLALEPEQWPEAIGRIAQGDAALADELHSLLATALEGQRQYKVRRTGDEADAGHDAERRLARLNDLDRETLAMAAQARRGGADDADDDRGALPSRPAAEGVARVRGPLPVPRWRRWLPPLLAVAGGVAIALVVRTMHG